MGRKDLAAAGGGAIAVLAAVVVVLLGTGRSAADEGATATHRQAGTSLVESLVTAVSLPRPTTTGAGANGQLPVPAAFSRGPAQARRTETWTVGEPFAAVRAWVLAHPPTGTRLVATHSVPGPANVSLRFAVRRRPAGVSAAGMTVALAVGATGSTVVSAQAEATWTVTRARSERVPAGVASIAASTAATGGRPTAQARITDPVTVRRVIALVDALPVVQPGRYSCPVQYAQTPRVTLRFLDRRGRALAVAAEDADVEEPTTACDALSFSADGRRMTPLLRGATFLGEVERLTGVTLSAPPFAA